MSPSATPTTRSWRANPGETLATGRENSVMRLRSVNVSLPEEECFDECLAALRLRNAGIALKEK